METAHFRASELRRSVNDIKIWPPMRRCLFSGRKTNCSIWHPSLILYSIRTVRIWNKNSVWTLGAANGVPKSHTCIVYVYGTAA